MKYGFSVCEAVFSKMSILFVNKQYLRDVPEMVGAIEMKRLFHRNIVQQAIVLLLLLMFLPLMAYFPFFRATDCVGVVYKQNRYCTSQAKPYFSCNCIRWIFKLDYRTKNFVIFLKIVFYEESAFTRLARYWGDTQIMYFMERTNCS